VKSKRVKAYKVKSEPLSKKSQYEIMNGTNETTKGECKELV
jgi:hypothetical protein